MQLLGILAPSFALVLPAVAPGFAAEADDTAPPPPRLQIINGRSHVIDIFWRTSARARAATGSVAAGPSTVITSTIGHRFSSVGRADRTEALVTAEVPVPGFRFDPPGPDRVSPISTRSIGAQGFPIVASARGNPSAPTEAAHLIDHHEYLAEGVPSWSDHHRENDHDPHHVSTRTELLAADPGLAAMGREVFGDTGRNYTRPVARLAGHLAGYDPTTALTFVRPERLKTTREEIRAQAKAHQPAVRPAQRSQS